MIARAVIFAGCVIALLTEGLPGLLFFAAVFGAVFGLCVLAHRAVHRD